MTEEQLKTLQDCGEAQMPIEESCIIAEISEEDFYGNEEVQKAYRKGQLITKLRIRQQVVKMAKEGVPTMVKIYLDKYDAETIGAEKEESFEDEVIEDEFD